jgi:pteridine reductase
MAGNTVLITGGAKRVGAVIARMLHGKGASIMIHYRSSRGEAEALVAELNALRPDSADVVHGDLLQTEDLPRLVEETVSRFGKLHVLINNASSFFPTAVGEITEEDWRDLIGTNLKAPLFLSQAAAPELIKTGGCIVNITDIHAERPMRDYVVYSIGKAGLVAATRSLARELAPAVRVNAVAPGPILWPEEDPNFDARARSEIIQHTPMQREGSPEDIARAVHFLVSEAPYVTGHVLAVDGGRSIRL